ncbi:MAG: DUF3667 domain-containing protein [Caulobacter sp.]
MAVPAEQPACDDCGTPLVGRFCHACGEDNAPPRRELRHLLTDLFDTFFSFTEHVPSTLRDLAIDPGRILRGLRDGDTKRYLSPFKLYVSATVLFFLFLGLFDVAFFQLRVERTSPGAPVVLMKAAGVDGDHFRLHETWLHPRTVAARDPQVVAAFDRFLAGPVDETNRSYVMLVRNLADEPARTNDLIATWAPRLLWLLMPVYALLLWPLYRRGTLVADHAIFALWAHTTLFLLLIVGALWNMTGLGGGLAVAMLLYQVYLTVGLKGYYGRSWAGAATKGLVHSAVYVGLIWLPLTAAFFFWQAMQNLPASFWES